jgi:PAS domain S-box-containing protein
MTSNRTKRSDDFLAGHGEMALRTRSFDWSRTPLGPIETWSTALRTTLQIVLASRFPHILWWGPDYIQLYNDAYCPIPGSKHPDKVLGRKASECWEEIWHVIGPLVDRPFSGGPATWVEDICLEPNRYGFVEETHFTIAYSPVPDETAPNGIGGVLATVHEITAKVVGERRIQALRDLGTQPSGARTAEEACAAAAATLRDHERDLPFALIYLLAKDRRSAHLAGAAGVEIGTPLSPDVLPLDESSRSTWPLWDVLRTRTPSVISDLRTRFDAIPPGPWSDPPSNALALPIPASRPGEIAGFFVAGLSPRLEFDEGYRAFVELVASQIGLAVANARAHEEEKRRAEELAEVDRLKNEFFSNVSHEFRTPLTLMLGPIEEEMRADPAARPRLEVAYRNSLRLLKLVNSLLDFSRIEAKRVDACYEPVDLAAFTAELASVFRSTVEKVGLALRVDCPPLEEPVFVDCEMWEKIVLNLLSNAFKFTFEGGIDVSLRRVGGEVELSVADTGIGIPESELPKVFQRFHRVRGARSRTHEGSGIGLALVHELVRLHGGSVAVRSEEGRGSTFTVRVRTGKEHLPADRIGAGRSFGSTALGATPFVEEALRWLPDVPAEPDPVSAADLPAAPRDAHPARILVVDDNADMREYVRRLLAPLYSVDAVSDGKAAFERAAADPPDLVLADVMMPGLDGFELLARLRANESTRTIPVMLLSARAGEESRIEGLRAGADDYLVKPFSARELVARVQSNLELRRVRREAEEAVRERGEQFETLIDRAPIGIFLVDEDFKIVHVNPIALPRFQEVAGEVRGRDFEEVLHVLREPSEADETVRIFRRTLETGEPFLASEDARRAQGHEEADWFEWRVDRIRLPGRPSRHGLVCYFRDITDEVRGKKEREFLLESERAARAEADRAVHLKDEFLAILSHELRSPLNAIAGWTYLLKSGAKDPERVLQSAQVIERNTKIQTQLISDLLDMSRIASGKMRLSIALVPPRTIVESAVQSMRPDAEAKGVALETWLGPVRGDCLWDQARIGQVLANLLSNAVKFTPKGGIVTVRLRQIDGNLEIVVRDTGIGIEAEYLPRLFDRFRQGDPATTREHGGLGLGLALVKQLVELHGGSVAASSEGKGRGSTFTVKLPLVPETWVRETTAGDARTPSLELHDLTGVRVLVTDDDPDVVEMVKRVLEECGAIVRTARSAAEALGKLADPVDVILSDIGMPERDGYDMIREIRERGVETPAIAMTAFVRVEDQEKALDSGYQVHLAKPLNPSRMIAAIASLVGRQRASAGAQP